MGAFAWCLDMKVKPSVGLVPLKKETSDSNMWEHSKKDSHLKAKSRLSLDTMYAGTLLVGFLASKAVRNKCPLCIRHPVCGILL